MKRDRFIDNAEIMKEVKALKDVVKKLVNIQEEDPLDAIGAAEFLHVTPDWLRDNYRKYKIPYHKPAGKLYFFKSELTGWIRENQELEETISGIAKQVLESLSEKRARVA